MGIIFSGNSIRLCEKNVPHCCCYVCPSARCGDHISPSFTTNTAGSILLNVIDSRETGKCC